MSVLSDWAEKASHLTVEAYQERDINTNDRIRALFFEQIENLAFAVKEVGSLNGKRTYELALKLDFPLKKNAPYKFLFETGTRTLVPQYTETHRVYKAKQDSKEDIILTNLEAYLLQNPDNDYCHNPNCERDRSTSFNTIHADRDGDFIKFDVYENIVTSMDDVDGHVVIYYNDEAIAYQDGSCDKDPHGNYVFVMLPGYKQVRIHTSRENGHVIYTLYNVTDVMLHNEKSFRAIARV